MFKVKYIKKIFLELIGLPIYFISFFCFRNKNVWVFGEWHGEKYSDNSKYFFEYVNSIDKSKRFIWITRSSIVKKEINRLGFRCAYQRSLKGIYYSLIAKYAFVTHGSNDINKNLLGGCILINLTHGTPLKKIGKDAGYKRLGVVTSIFDSYISTMLPLGKKFNYVFCADEIAKDRFQSAYNYPVMILPFGYPRWAGLYSKDIDICRLISQYDKVISYLPTLRFNNHQQLDPFSFQGFSDFCKFLENKNYLLIVRPHPSMVFENEHSVSSNVVFIRSNEFPDVNKILSVTDLLISDYSSVIYDFQITRKPILLLAPDADTYINKDVGVYGDYYSEFDCPIVFSWSGLIPHIESKCYESFLLENNSLNSSKKIYSYIEAL